MFPYMILDALAPVDSIPLVAVNDPKSMMNVYSNRLEIIFFGEYEPRIFYVDIQELYKKIDCLCHSVCFDNSVPRKRRLRFDLERLDPNSMHTIRISILRSLSDNFRIEVSRSELLAALAFFFK